MRIIDCEQGSKEWHDARIGIPTASRFNNIITAKTMKLSKQAEGYMYELAAEWLIGEPCDNSGSAFMDRGINQEKEAVRFYEFQKDVEARKVGLCLRDDGLVGCSPDRLIGDNGGLEIKCPAAKTHIMYLLDSVGDDYKTQVQGSLYVCEREWWDVMSYNPVMPPAIERHYRDDEFIAKFTPLLEDFLFRLNDIKTRLKQLGITEQIGDLDAMSDDESKKRFADMIS